MLLRTLIYIELEFLEYFRYPKKKMHIFRTNLLENIGLRRISGRKVSGKKFRTGLSEEDSSETDFT